MKRSMRRIHCIVLIKLRHSPLECWFLSHRYCRRESYWSSETVDSSRHSSAVHVTCSSRILWHQSHIQAFTPCAIGARPSSGKWAPGARCGDQWQVGSAGVRQARRCLRVSVESPGSWNSWSQVQLYLLYVNLPSQCCFVWPTIRRQIPWSTEIVLIFITSSATVIK